MASFTGRFSSLPKVVVAVSRNNFGTGVRSNGWHRRQSNMCSLAPRSVITTSYRRRTSEAADIPLAKKGLVASEDEKREFLAVFPDVIHDLTHYGALEDLVDAQKWHAKVVQYNVKGGKLNRGLAVGLSFKLIAPSDLYTPENVQKTHILGWCIEMLQGFFLVLDDLIDGSELRRGKTAWHAKSEIGLSSVNDAVLLENGIYKVLHAHFRNEPYYAELLELFHNVTLKTSLGQCLDLLSCPANKKPNLELFTMERYNAIIKYKTAYYSFYLPVACAMYMAGIRNTDYARISGITDQELHRQAKTILLEMGSFFQVQDDYLDCFGNPTETGKIGVDISEGKCSWLAVVALQRASAQQRKIMETHYGSKDPTSIEIIRTLYKDLGLPATFRAYEESTVKLIRVHIQQISRGLNHNVFFKLLEKICNRSA